MTSSRHLQSTLNLNCWSDSSSMMTKSSRPQPQVKALQNVRLTNWKSCLIVLTTLYNSTWDKSSPSLKPPSKNWKFQLKIAALKQIKISFWTQFLSILKPLRYYWVIKVILLKFKITLIKPFHGWKKNFHKYLQKCHNSWLISNNKKNWKLCSQLLNLIKLVTDYLTTFQKIKKKLLKL
jgi:hypothetical protein